MNAYDRQRGFVLITSLIFLVVVTLLAVSAINRSTLQEKIAANTRARETATQHANAALRAGEALLRDSAFETYQNADTDVDVTVDSGQGSNTKTIHIWLQGEIPVASNTGNTIDEAVEFLKPSVWANDNKAPIKYKPNDTLVAQYYIEELDGCYQTNLNPDACASGNRTVIYRITARATLEKRNATVVTQSTFAKYY